MSFFQAIVLAVVQGLTEFLPISSSGHLVILQKVFGFDTPPVFFDVLLHLGTLVAVLFFFKREIISLTRQWRQNSRLIGLLILASLPAAIFGFLLFPVVNKIFNSLILVGGAMIFTGFTILSTQFVRIRKKAKMKDALVKITWEDALIIGFSQGLAILPGISRSGLTINSGIWRNFSIPIVFYFSFLLAIPAILGAAFLQIQNGSVMEINLPTGIAAVLITGIVGFFSLKFLKKILISDKFYYFGFYCLIVGLLILSSQVK